MTKRQLYPLILAAVALLATLTALWWPRERTATKSEFALGTIIEITATGLKPEAALTAAFQEIKRVEKLTSSHADSDIGQINRAAGLRPVQVSADTIQILQFVRQVYPIVSGAFDPTVAPLVDLWGFGYNGQPRLPAASRIRQLLRLVDYRQVKLDIKKRTVMLAKPGMRLDLGGIAKGYAVDRAYQVLRRSGISSALINGGSSSIRVIGRRVDRRPWQIGIGHPRRSGSLLGRLTLPSDRALGTSADTQNFLIKNQTRYHHLINPHTGYPAEGKILLTVTAPTAMEADLLSTACFILPAGQIKRALKQLPGVKVLFVDKHQKVFNLNEDHFLP